MYVFSAEGGDALGIKLECTYKFTKDSEFANPVGSPWWQRIGQFGEIEQREALPTQKHPVMLAHYLGLPDILIIPHSLMPPSCFLP